MEPGHTDGSRITIEGAGDEEVGAEKAGDLIFIIAVQPHASFRLVDHTGFDLECDATLTLSELLLGFDRIVTVHLDGRHLQVRHRATIEPGTENRVLLRGEGLRKGKVGANRPSTSRTSSANSNNSTGSASVKGSAANGEERGDLWIRLKTEQTLSHWLQSLSADQRKQLESMLPAKRPPLDVEPDQVHVMKNPQVLTVSSLIPALLARIRLTDFFLGSVRMSNTKRLKRKRRGLRLTPDLHHPHDTIIPEVQEATSLVLRSPMTSTASLPRDSRAHRNGAN